MVKVDNVERQSYLVWAIPPDDVSGRIKKLMESFRAEFGGAQVEPHIPVVGSLRMKREDAVKTFRSVNRGPFPMHSFVCKVDGVVTRSSYYQCVSLHFHRSEEFRDEIISCSSHFGYYNGALPHLSLLYGNLAEEERKRAQGTVSVLDESITNLSFPITRLALYKTDCKDKTLKSWAKIS